MKLVFTDTETTGLDARIHEAFEVALIVVDGDEVTEHEWWIDVDLSTADPAALRINRYYERAAQRPKGIVPAVAAEEIAPLVADSVLIGANPAFDERFLEALLRRHGQGPAWHYRVFDIETAAAAVSGIEPPWKSSTEMCASALGVEPPTEEDRHTAMGDCRWVKAVYDAVYHRARPAKRARRSAPPRKGAVSGEGPATPERSTHPLLSASPRAFVDGLAKLADPVIVAHLLDDAMTSDADDRRTAAIRARLEELQSAPQPELESDVDSPSLESETGIDDEPSDDDTPSGRPSGMPAEDERPPCDICGRDTEGPRKPGAPSAGQLSWTRYRRILCFDDLEKMKVIT